MKRPLRVALIVFLALASAPALLLAPAVVGVHATGPKEIGVVHQKLLEPDRPRRAPRQIIVGFHRDADHSVVEGALRDVGGIAARRSRFGARYLVTLDEGQSVPLAVARLRSLPDVDYAEPNGAVHAFFHPNDPRFPLQWHMRMVNAERTWDLQMGDPSVIVAIVDTGIAYEDFGRFRKAPDWGAAGQGGSETVFVPGLNVLTGTEHANDDNFHGTHVASTVAEATNNGKGVTGLAFRCALMPVKALDNEGNGFIFDIAEGIDFASSHGARVINLSLGGDDVSETLTQAIDRAIAAGAVVVAAAGNDGRGSLSFPASLGGPGGRGGLISVGAVDARKERAAYSNFGPQLDLVAPGGDVGRDDDLDGFPDGILQQTFDPDTAARLGRYDDFHYCFVDGTSVAAPHVSAAAALLIRQGIRDPASIKAALTSTAEDLGPRGRDDTFGAGLVRPAMALAGLGLNQ